MNQRTQALADRLEHGARALDSFTSALTTAEWEIPVPKDGRRAAPVSLYSDAPLTCQFVLEDHAVRHSYHHLARIQKTLQEKTR